MSYWRKCGGCQKQIWTHGENEMGRFICLARGVYCSPCAIEAGSQSIKKEVEALAQKNKELEERVQQLEKTLKDMLSFAPEGSEYTKVKEHFDGVAKKL